MLLLCSYNSYNTCSETFAKTKSQKIMRLKKIVPPKKYAKKSRHPQEYVTKFPPPLHPLAINNECSLIRVRFLEIPGQYFQWFHVITKPNQEFHEIPAHYFQWFHEIAGHVFMYLLNLITDLMKSLPINFSDFM